ncbi:viroplasmin family protein [Fusobacterium sp. PH5-44]|uniref:ribonuclease H1 domain-containing protein n=1 Tax=unclassified Fusobacterium TaxID=2648384 RepID=UPI003D1A4167
MSQKIYGYFLIDEKKSGIVDSWDKCQNATKGKKSRYKSFKTLAECNIWIENGCQYESKEVKEQKKIEIQNNMIDGIYFDAGTGRGIGVEVRVTDKHGNSLINEHYHSFPLNEYGNIFLGKERTNNFGELLGLSIALDFALKSDTKNIFGDSNLVIEYWSHGHFNKGSVNDDTIKLINYVVKRRKKYEVCGGKIAHISGDINPADLGFHK